MVAEFNGDVKILTGSSAIAVSPHAQLKYGKKYRKYSQIRRAVFVRFSLGGSEFRLAMTDLATIAGMEVAKLVPWNSLLNY